MSIKLPNLPNYTVLEVLRETALGASWLLMHNETLQRSVLKCIPLAFIGREEYQWLATAQHPRLPRVIGTWFDENFYLHYDFVDGIDLNQYVLENGPMAEEQLRTVATQILDILAYLHRQVPPIVFRDLKPSNLILTPEGEVVLIDLASIRSIKHPWAPEGDDASDASASDTVVLGTVGYAAPEAYGFFKTDERSDIFSFGATLYFLGTGNHINQRDKNQNRVSTPLQEIIGKCTSFDPEFRYQNVDVLRPLLLPLRIHHWTLNSPVSAFRPNIPLEGGLESLLQRPILGMSLPSESGAMRLNFHLDAQREVVIANPIYPMNLLPIAAEVTVQMDLGDNEYVHITFQTNNLDSVRFDGQRQQIYIPAAPEAGFHYPYFLIVPPGITDANQLSTHLMVTPPLCHYHGNSDRHQTLDSALQAITADLYQEFHNASGCVRLYPALPRYRILVDGKWAYASFFDSTVLSLSTSSQIINLDQDHPITETQIWASQRLDQQLLAMLSHAQAYLATQGVQVDTRHLMFGGGSSGHFAYRMSLLHPEVVHAIVALAINGHVTLPCSSYQGVDMPFPIGLSGIEAWGVSLTAAQLETFKALPKFIYMPNVDNNDVLYEEQCYTENQRQAVIATLGERMLPDRWHNTIKALENLGVRALCVTGEMPHRGFTTHQIQMINQFIALCLQNADTLETLMNLDIDQTKVQVLPQRK